MGSPHSPENCNLCELLVSIGSGPDSVKLSVNLYKIGDLQMIFLSTRIANEFCLVGKSSTGYSFIALEHSPDSYLTM